jgi:hypothetical protein
VNTHKVYLSILAAACVLATLFAFAWRERVRDQARRDAVMETQKSEISDIERRIASAGEQAQAQIAELERRRATLLATPERAPEVIRELVPMRTPVQSAEPAAASSAKSPPDAPSVSLNKQQEVDLAQYALACKECSVERDQFEQQVKDEQEIVSRQKIELDADKKAARGGSLWQRTKRIVKWGVMFGGVGYVIGRAQR